MSVEIKLCLRRKKKNSFLYVKEIVRLYNERRESSIHPTTLDWPQLRLVNINAPMKIRRLPRPIRFFCVIIIKEAIP